MIRTPFSCISRSILFTTAAVLLLPLTSEAGIHERYGVGPRAMALGGAYTALSDDWTAPYYNPAGLAQARTIETGAGFFTAFPDFEIRLSSTGSEDLRQFPADRESADSIIALDLGLVLPLNRLGNWRLPMPINVGALFSIPNLTTATTHLLPERFPQHVLLDDRNIAATMNLGVATQITPAFSFGVGVTMRARQSMESLPGYTSDALSARTKSDLTAAVTAGFLFRPAEDFSLGIAYQGELRSRARIVEGRIAVLNFQQELLFVPTDRTERTFSGYFEPRHVSAGAAYRITERLLVSASVTWYSWSDYETTQDAPPPNDFDDTFVPGVGVEYRLTKDWTLRGGFLYEETPVTDQPSGFNFVGNDRYIPSLGAGWRFEDPFDFFENPIRISYVFQYHHLVSRTFEKEGPPRDPDITSKGWIITSGLSITLTF